MLEDAAAADPEAAIAMELLKQDREDRRSRGSNGNDNSGLWIILAIVLAIIGAVAFVWWQISKSGENLAKGLFGAGQSIWDDLTGGISDTIGSITKAVTSGSGAKETTGATTTTSSSKGGAKTNADVFTLITGGLGDLAGGASSATSSVIGSLGDVGKQVGDAAGSVIGGVGSVIGSIFRW